jgi:DNA-binding Lrp family transcriptional regulator
MPFRSPPRASWAVAGRALGVDPGTAARRWQRLVKHGLAWVTCYPADRHMEDMGSAYIEVDCAPGHVSDVGEQLTRRSHVVTVEHVSGEHNLLLTILAPGLVDLSHRSFAPIQVCACLLDGTATVEEVGAEIYGTILAVASGQETKSESMDYGEEEFVLWHIGTVM